MTTENKENEYYDGGEEEIDINKLNELEKEKFEKDFLSIISYKEDKNSPKKNIINKNDDKALSTTTCESSKDENILTKFNSLKSKIDDIEKEIKLYSENKELLNKDESLQDCLIKFKKIKEHANFIVQSKNYIDLKKIFEKQNSGNEEKLDNYQLLQNKMNENLNIHLINRANIINKLKIDNPDLYNNLEYELYVNPETKKLKKISKIIEIKEKLKKIKNNIGEWDMEQNKNNLISTIDELKMNIKLLDQEFINELDKQRDLIVKRVKEAERNDDFYNIIDKEYIDSLFAGFTNNKEIENIITDTVSKMENLRDGHEVSAYVGLKLQEMIDQQEKLGDEMNNNNQILINLKKNIKNNIEVMKKNIEILKAKINSKK